MTEQIPLDTATGFVSRIDRLPVVGGLHRIWVTLLAIIFVFDSADLSTFALVAPKLREQWGLTVTDIGWTTSAAFFGMFVGALAGGSISDRFGRKLVIVTGALLYSVSSLLSAVSVSLGMLIVTRVLTGVGIEAMTVAALAFIAEMFPPTVRGRFQALVVGLSVIGLPLMSWFARQVVPVGTDGWRWVFVFGSVGTIAGIAIIWVFPESVRWQAMHGRAERAEKIIQRMEDEAEKRYGGPLPEPQPVHYEPARPRMLELFSGKYRKRTVVACLAWVFSILGFYGFNSWTPTLLNIRGFSVSTSLTYTSIVALAAAPGALSAWFLADRFERKKALFTVNVVVAAMMLLYGFVDNVVVILGAGILVMFFLHCQTALLYGYTPDLFPTSLRGAGTGITNGSGRLAGVIGGYLVALIAEQLGLGAVFVYIAGAMILSGGVLLLFGEKVTGRKLDTAAET